MSGCQSTQFDETDPSPRALESSSALLQQVQSARSSEQRRQLQLLAARALLNEQNAEAALALLEDLVPSDLSREQRQAAAKISSEALVQLGDYMRARQALARIETLQTKHYLLLGRVCSALNQHQCAADAYIQAAHRAGLESSDLPADIHDLIWFSLSRARQAPTEFTQHYHHAWWQLQQQLRQAVSAAAQVDTWQQWQRANPSHPAHIRPPQLLQQLNRYALPHIAVLLPLSGPLAGAGGAVRDGLIGALLSDQTANKPSVRFYDTQTQDLGPLYEKILSTGADVIVGPLLKDQTERFAELTQFDTIPRLLLNYPSPPDSAMAHQSQADQGLFKFGIAIEDEISSLADHVMHQGHEKVAVIHSRDSWSLRAREAYLTDWPYPAIQASFGDIKGITAAVGDAMQVTASDARRDEIARILGKSLEFQPRARSDLDAIIALTSHIEAQALVPALSYHFADELPVFATSQIARGEDLSDLTGFQLTEMPLFASPDAKSQTLARAFELRGNPLGELYALGMDAYAIATWLPLLNHSSQIALNGTTGEIELRADGAFHRILEVSEINRTGGLDAAL